MRLSFLLFMAVASLPVASAPTGKDLLEVCEAALENGFWGMEGRMCEYYVRPCDCEFVQETKTPRVCLPESVDTPSLARKVITGLTAGQDLQRRNADYAAAVILSGDYPCR